ncbi:CASP-like protein 2B2 [Bienertia sinuspersici]
MSFGGVGISPGNVTVYHGSCNVRVAERKVRIAELVEVKVIFSITKKAKFIDMKSLVFFMTVNGIVATYSLVQAVRCIVGMIRGSILFSKPLDWIIFSGDH